MSITHLNRPPIHRACWVSDAREADAFGNAGVPIAQPRGGRQQPTLARFVLEGPGLPLVTDTLPVAEAFRAAAMSQFERVCRREPLAAVGEFRRRDRPERFASPVLAGKDADGQPRLGHEHAYYLPAAESPGGRLDHLTVHAPGGLGPEETAALAAIRELAIRCGEPSRTRRREEPTAPAAIRELSWDGPLAVRLIGLAQPGECRAPLLGPARVGVGHAVFGHPLSQAERHPARPTRELRHRAGLRRARAARGAGPAARPPPPAPLRPAGRGAHRRIGNLRWATAVAPDTIRAFTPETRRRRRPPAERSVPHRVRGRGARAVVFGPFLSLRPGAIRTRKGGLSSSFFGVIGAARGKVVNGPTPHWRVRSSLTTGH